MSSRLARAALLAAGIALVLPLAPAGAQEGTTTTATPQERVSAITRPAIVYTEQYFRAWVRVPRSSGLYFQGYVNEGNPFEWGTRCSGFAVNPGGYLVTAGHCVDLGEEGARARALAFATQWLIDNGYAYAEDFDYWLTEAHASWGVEGTERGSEPDFEMWVQRGVAAGGLTTGEALPARVVAYQPWSQGDVALIKVEQSDLPVVLIAETADVSIGTEVLSVGYPGSTDILTDASLEPTFKDGQINSEKTRGTGLLPVYEVSADMSGGMSGGPTVDLDGQVVGVNSFGTPGESQSFNFITPASLVSEVLAQNGVSNELGPLDVTYREGVDAYFGGDFQTALDRFEQVLAIAPTHQQAEEYRQQAARRLAENPPAEDEGDVAQPAPAAEDEGFPVWAIVLIGAGVLGAAALVVLALRRRPTAATAAAAPTVVPAPAAASAPVAVAAPASVPAAPAVGPRLRAVDAPEAARFCSSCGHGIEPGARFCPSCGHQIEIA